MSTLFAPALLMGLFGGVHCITMCGPVSSVLCGKVSAGRHGLMFNLGRVGSYTALGFAAGALGSWTVGHGLDPLRFGLRVLATVVMLTVGLHLAGLPSAVRTIESAGAPLWRLVAPIARRLLPLRTPGQALGAGALWALMPCGLLYSALATSASAYSAREGATTMLAFALGTLPAMLGFGAIVARAAVALPHLRRVAGVLVLACGLWSIASVAAQANLVPLAVTACAHH